MGRIQQSNQVRQRAWREKLFLEIYLDGHGWVWNEPLSRRLDACLIVLEGPG